MRSFARVLSFIVGAGIVTGCEIADDQTLSKQVPALEAAANPKPLAINYAAENKAHTTLLAVIDSGVDYTHPLLAKNMHYELDAQGKPLGVGWDYIGNDKWASPYLARTAHLDPTADQKRISNAKFRMADLQKALTEIPELKAFISAERQEAQELDSGSYHGTHVAGLMVYDRPDFGLLAYRVLPFNMKDNDDWGFFYDYTTKDFIPSLKDAMERAGKLGVRVVNMSLGLTAEKPVKSGDEDPALDEEYLARLQLGKELAEIAKRYPKTLYVASAGNEGAWIDGKNRMTFPCSTDSPNVLCVGSADEKGDISSFSNIILNKSDLVFTLGEYVLSTMPTAMCRSQEADTAFAYLTDDKGDPKPMDREKLKALVGICTQSAMRMGRLSGTSMAAPLISRAAAEVFAAHPEYTGAQVISALKQQSKPIQVGNYLISRLNITKPSWYGRAGRELNWQPYLRSFDMGRKLVPVDSGFNSKANEKFRDIARKGKN